jgi:hypothetical protein
MRKDHTGQPSGANKSEGTGLRPDMPPEKLEQDNELTDKYTSGEDEVSDDIKMRHPNRNPSKPDATNDGGYKQ